MQAMQPPLAGTRVVELIHMVMDPPVGVIPGALCVELKLQARHAAALELVEDVDCMPRSFRPESMAGNGIDNATLSQGNSGLGNRRDRRHIWDRQCLHFEITALQTRDLEQLPWICLAPAALASNP